jgi:hypothetical protein
MRSILRQSFVPYSSGYLTYRADQIGHGRASCRITTVQEPRHTRRVRNTLDSKLARATNKAGNLVEEQRTYSRCIADVALLGSSTGVDQANRAAGGAVRELVIGAAAVLAFREGVVLEGETARDFGDGVGFGVGDGCGGCESAGKHGEREEGELHGG